VEARSREVEDGWSRWCGLHDEESEARWKTTGGVARSPYRGHAIGVQKKNCPEENGSGMIIRFEQLFLPLS
jgi:hypothetical protein